MDREVHRIARTLDGQAVGTRIAHHRSITTSRLFAAGEAGDQPYLPNQPDLP